MTPAHITRLMTFAQHGQPKEYAASGMMRSDLESLLFTTSVPRIGQPWPGQGGIYAGIEAGRDGQPDYHLIAAPADQGSFENIEWGPFGKSIDGATSYFDGRANTAAMAAADIDLGKRIVALQIDGHTDYYLPSQAEMHLLAANLKDQFEQDDWYWTSTQYSSDSAWGQYFDGGDQSSTIKDVEARARAVRRFSI